MNVNDEIRMCPIINENITIDECFDVCMVVACGCPIDFADEKIISKENFKEVCANCFYCKNL